MREEWEFDALEEQEAKVELERLAELEVVEEEKRKQRDKKKQQAEARKRARKEAADRIARDVKEEEEREKSSPGAVDGLSLEKKGRYTPSNSLLGPGMPGLFLPSHIHSAASPSPLRHSTSAYDQLEDQPQNGVDHDVLLDVDRAPESDAAHSPAPTHASYGDFTGGHSGYTSENNHPEKLQEQDQETDNDNEMDLDHELEAMIS
jgi:COMPASS component BRE2